MIGSLPGWLGNWPPVVRRAVSASTAALMMVAVMTLPSAWAAFTGGTANSGNAVGAGTVTLTDNDSSDTLKVFNLSGLLPGDTATGCVKVTYTGSLPATVKLYAPTSGTGLGSYIDLTVTRGTIAGAVSTPDCTGFVADTADYKGAGAGVLYSGTLAAYPATAAAGQQDLHNAAGLAEAWTTTEVHAYRFVATVQNNTAAQGLTAAPVFSWAADNTTAYSQVILSDDPASYWKLDEAAGTTATDSVGGLNGTYTNGPVLNGTGVKDANTAVSFDGVNDSVVVSDQYDFAGNAAFSVEFWMNRSASGSNQRIVSKERYTSASSWGGWEVMLGPTSAVHFLRMDGGSTSSAILTPVTATATWYHVVATYGSSTMRLYLNGTAVTPAVGSAFALEDSTVPLTFAQMANNSLARYFPGKIDEVAIYSRALTAQQVTDHYTAGRR
jgi:hypothetical protein